MTGSIKWNSTLVELVLNSHPLLRKEPVKILIANNVCHQPGITQEVIQNWAGPDRETHQVGLWKNNGKSRDLIVCFICYRDCTNVFYHKRNLKNYNHNPSTSSKVFINEALTKLRLTILFEAIKFVRNKLVNSGGLMMVASLLNWTQTE